MIDIGSGPPVVLIPGIQGRWEWMRPAVMALAARARVISFSLAGEPGTNVEFRESAGFDCLTAQVAAALDRAGVGAATLCGVSFGGLVALRFAARRPNRTHALVLVSTPGPAWRPPMALRRCMRYPRLHFPFFCLRAARRTWRELSGTFPDRLERVQMAARYAGLVLSAPAAPSRMSRRAWLALETDFKEDCQRVSVPTLVVTGDPEWDEVVSTATTLEYLRLIPGARAATLESTGHLGAITQPERFARLVADFASAHGGARQGPLAAETSAAPVAAQELRG